jgi:hypothetical protein
LVGSAALPAQSLLPPERVPLDSLAAFLPTTANWRLAGGIAGNPRQEKTLSPADGTGVLVNTPADAARGHLFTTWEHGDLEFEVDFLLPVGSNSGVYLQGRYEIQLFDSWGVKAPTFSDCGGIYQRWDATRPAGQQGSEGHAPRSNAARAPGLWQHLHVVFEAPRFDANGNKTRPARFVRVALNGFTIHENVELTGPTRAAAFNDERPVGPLMFQGDHGPVALRRLAFKRGNPERITPSGLRYRFHPGVFTAIGAYDSLPPQAEGVPDRFSLGAVDTPGKFALTFSGSLLVPRAGDYAFAVDGSGVARLIVGGRTVVVPLERGSQPGTVKLAAGPHPFRLDLIHSSNGPPRLELLAEGPGLASHAVTIRETSPARPGGGRGPRAPQLLVEPEDRVLVMRGFVPFEPRKQLYAASIGSPAGVHYAYDFETAALLRAWRGSFIDAFEMWDGRGINQIAKPTGPALTFTGKPTVAWIEFATSGDWPDRPETVWTSQGYTLERDGQPVFLARLADLTLRDRIAPTPDGRGLSRRLVFAGELPSWSVWVLLAEAESITPQPGGGGWIVGDREWYLDWPASAATPAVVRQRQGRAQLAVPLTNATLGKPIEYSITW